MTIFSIGNYVLGLADTGSTNVSCGQVVNGNVTLTANLLCTEDGLIVGSDSTIINLNGYSIEGTSDNSKKVGISAPHSNNITVEGPGTIRYFQAGILISGSIGTQIHNIKFEENKIAVFMTGSIESTVEQNDIGPNTIGVASHSSRGTQVHNNNMTANTLAGVTFVDTDKSQVNSNSIGGSKNGIYLNEESSKNTIMNNIAMKNDIDINNADGLEVVINQNEFNNNKCNTSDPNSICR